MVVNICRVHGPVFWPCKDLFRSECYSTLENDAKVVDYDTLPRMHKISAWLETLKHMAETLGFEFNVHMTAHRPLLF